MSYLLQGGPPTSNNHNSSYTGAPAASGYVPSAAASGYSQTPSSSYSTGAYTPSAAAMGYSPSASTTGYSAQPQTNYQQPQTTYQQHQQQQQPHSWASQVAGIVNHQTNSMVPYSQHTTSSSTGGYQPTNTNNNANTQIPTGMKSATSLLIEVCVLQYGKKEKVDLEVEPTASLNVLKEMAAPKIGIFPHQQIVKYNDREITDPHDWSLQRLGIPSLARLDISKRESAALMTIILHPEDPNRTIPFSYRPQTLDLELDFNDTTLADIREIVAQETRLPVHEIQLKYQKKNLDSATLTLQKLNFKDGAELLVHRKEPTMPKQQTGNNSHSTMMNQAANGQDIQALRIEFDKIDTDRSGYIDQRELSKSLRWVPASMVKMAMTYADSNRDGKIDFKEYCKIRKTLGGMKIPKMGGNKK